MKKRILIPSILVLFFLVVLVATFFSIYSGVKENCLRAKNKYHEDCVNSLMKLVQNEENSLRERNSAVWALGQMADKKALPFLYELEKSLPSQEKCHYDEFLCRYEVEKAIKWCEKGNLTSWMYQI